MSITIKISQSLSQYTNDRGIAEVNGSTVRECLDDLIKQFPRIEKGIFDKSGGLLHYVSIWVNGEDTYPQELARTVKDGDELYLTYIVSVGGG